MVDETLGTVKNGETVNRVCLVIFNSALENVFHF
jgi:hypothetical protein